MRRTCRHCPTSRATAAPMATPTSTSSVILRLKQRPTHCPSQGRKSVYVFKFFEKDSPLLPSGLMGPVEVRVEKAEVR